MRYIPMEPPHQFHFPPFRLDLRDERLWQGSRAMPLTPKAFAVLRHLVEHHGRLVTKDELLEAVWPRVHVGDTVLKGCIRELRRAMNDLAGTPRLIQTVHRRGYRFIGLPAEPADAPAALATRGPAHFVGRERELALLRSSLHRALDGERQVVMVTGEPGIGKRSLVEVFLREVAPEKLWVARGQCVEQAGSGEAYLPVLDALDRLGRERDRTQLVSLLRRYAPIWLAQMPALIDPEDRGALQQDGLGVTSHRMLREVTEAIDALTATVPLVLLLEDLHWTDRGTVDLLFALGRRPDAARLLVIGTYRPSMATPHRHALDAAVGELLDHRLCQEIELGLLGEDAVAEYVARRFPGHHFPDALTRLVHAHTDGHPLFMTEALDELVRRGALAETAPGWSLRVPVDEIRLGVPRRLEQMIDHQIGRLSPDEQSVLAAASAAGADFTAADIAAALETDVEVVEVLCDGLARYRQFLSVLGPKGDGPPGSRYAFVHSLYRQTIAAGLGEERSSRLHMRIGRHREAVAGSQAASIAPQLAMHFERGRDFARALRYLGLAAENAMQCHANREAADYLHRALVLVDRAAPEEREKGTLLLLERLGMARRSVGDMRGAAEMFSRLSAVARDEQEMEIEVRALLHEAAALSWINREGSLEAAGQALALSDRLPDGPLRAITRGHVAFGRLLSSGWSDDDARACGDALEAARVAGDRRALSLNVSRQAYVECHRSEYRAACRFAEEGLLLALEIGDAFHYMSCQYHRAWALLHLGDLGRTREVVIDGLQMATRNCHQPWEQSFRFMLGALHVTAGDCKGARDLCADELGRMPQGQLGRFFGLIVLARAYAGLGERRLARECYEEVVRALAREHMLMDWIVRLPLHFGLADHALSEGELERARHHATEMLGLASASGERTYIALARWVLAEAALATGDHRQAEQELVRARSVLVGGDAPHAAWRVDEGFARIHDVRKQTPKAKEYRAQSAAVFLGLADSLRGSPELRRTLLASPRPHPQVFLA